MGDWRGRALTQFPELRGVIEQESWSCHVFLSELWLLALEAHREDQPETLRRVYGFARWCFDQPGQFLPNAALISFYDHVFDDWDLRREVVGWLPPEVVARARALWEWRLPSERFAEVDRLLTAGDPPGENCSEHPL
ncbi:hypothetical protein F0L68_09360 [Solihabitans fulvus]|uniref:DUF7674 domain-containing protein n=1 Tax=Solihabitans fulvus TaxID=1892852 RepID=A0A5B2XL73_9PSEU|nr:hypothetical protein [Solihabitans fulvus]KAA2263690.1 hypothetical protein F0L68_09360 [Solihabitans fulvus]